MIELDTFVPFDSKNDNTQYSFRKIKTIIAATSLALSVSFVEISDVEQLQPIGEIVEYGELDFVVPQQIDVKISDEAKKYLTENRDVAQIVSDIEEKVPLFFAAKTLLVDLIFSPDENYSQIEISVICNDPIDVALEMLDQFDDSWWLDFDKPRKEDIIVDVVSYV